MFHITGTFSCCQRCITAITQSSVTDEMYCRRRFDVYVCTAAERGYALEAWRLLDHNSDIIPDAVRAARVVCVPGGQKKELRKVLHVQAAIKFETGVFKVVNRFCINKVFSPSFEDDKTFIQHKAGLLQCICNVCICLSSGW